MYSLSCSAETFCFNLGAKVTALVRDLSRLPEEIAPKINVVNGNSTIKEDVAKALEGQDAVIVALGTRHDLGGNILLGIQMKMKITCSYM